MHSCINATVLNTQHIFTLVSLLYWFCIAQTLSYVVCDFYRQLHELQFYFNANVYTTRSWSKKQYIV